MALIQTDVSANLTMAQKFFDKAGDFAISLIVAILILVVTLWAAGWAARLVRRGIARMPHGEHPADTTLAIFAASLVRYTVIAIGLIAVLQQLGMQTTSILAVFGAASLAIGLAMQGTLSNVAAGVMILLFRPYRVGDQIEIGGRTGRVEALDLFATELVTPDNVKVLAPNGKIFGDVIINYSAHENRRVDVIFKVDLKRDLPAVLAGLKARAQADPRVLKEPAPTVEVLGMSEAWVEAAVRAWAMREDHGAVKSDLMLTARLLADGAELPPLPEARPIEKPAPRKRRRLMP